MRVVVHYECKIVYNELQGITRGNEILQKYKTGGYIMIDKLTDGKKIKEVCDIIINNLDNGGLWQRLRGGYTISNKDYEVSVTGSLTIVKDNKGNELFCFEGSDLLSCINTYRENRASVKADEFINDVTGDKNGGEVKYKIYRGIDKRDGKDTVFLENQEIMLTITIATWENFKDVLIPKDDSCCYYGDLKEQCDKPKLLFEIEK